MSLEFIAGYVLGEQGRASARLAATAANAAQGSAARKHDVYSLNDRIDRLTITVAAMWSLLQDQGMTEKQLIDRIRELDEADGVADGKVTRQSSVCNGCGAKVAPGLDHCQFCGGDVTGDSATDPFAAI